jgi:hypothetical protein
VFSKIDDCSIPDFKLIEFKLIEWPDKAKTWSAAVLSPYKKRTPAAKFGSFALDGTIAADFP